LLHRNRQAAKGIVMGVMGWIRTLLAGRHREERPPVAVDDRGVAYRRPDGTVESVAWAELRGVEIVTTDAGPWSEDVFWVLYGQDGGCAVPQGAKGVDVLLERLQRLPGFDYEASIRAMKCTEDARFPCWHAADA
jgi:hypothetical protein